MIYLNKSAAYLLDADGKEYLGELFKIGWTKDEPRKRGCRLEDYKIHNPTIKCIKEIPGGTLQQETLLCFKFRRYKFSDTSDEWLYPHPEIEKYFETATLEDLEKLSEELFKTGTNPKIEELDKKYPGCVSKLKENYCVEEIRNEFGMSRPEARTLGLLFQITFVESLEHLEEIKSHLKTKFSSAIECLEKGCTDGETSSKTGVNLPEITMLRYLFNLLEVDNTDLKKEKYLSDEKFSKAIDLMKKGWSNTKICSELDMINETVKNLRELFKDEINPSEDDKRKVKEETYLKEYPYIVEMLRDKDTYPNIYDIVKKTKINVRLIAEINRFFKIRNYREWVAKKPDGFPADGSKEFYEFFYQDEIEWLKQGYSQAEVTKMSPRHPHHKTLDKIQEIFKLPEKTVFDLFDYLGDRITKPIYEEFKPGDEILRTEVFLKMAEIYEKVDPRIKRKPDTDQLKYFFDIDEKLVYKKNRGFSEKCIVFKKPLTFGIL